MIKQTAKVLLEYGDLESYVKSFIDEGTFDFLTQRLKDYYFDEVYQGILEKGEDLEDYTPMYESWEELYDSEHENIIETGARILTQELDFDPSINRDNVFEIVSKEIEIFLRKSGGADIFD